MLRLVRPTHRYKASYLDALEEHRLGSASAAGIAEEIKAVDLFIERQRTGAANYRAYWLVDDGLYVGTFQLKPFPADSQLYYDVRPTRRGLGYGRVLFRLAIRIARRRKLMPLRFRVDGHNLPSIRIAIAGGAIENDGAAPVIDFVVER